MNCDMGFSHSFGAPETVACLLMSRGELANGGIFVPKLYA